MPEIRLARRLATELSEASIHGAQRPDLLMDAAKELQRLDQVLHSPSIDDFLKSVRLESAHQSERGRTQNDDQKTPEDWCWLLEYLTAKAVNAWNAGDTKKALHHTISSAAVLYHWHEHIAKPGDGTLQP